MRRESLIPINLNTASETTILGVVGIENAGLMRRIVSRRKAHPLGPADAASLAVDPDLIQRLGPYVSVRSSFFRILVVAHRQGHSASIQALVRRDTEGKIDVIQWVL